MRQIDDPHLTNHSPYQFVSSTSPGMPAASMASPAAYSEGRRPPGVRPLVAAAPPPTGQPWLSAAVFRPYSTLIASVPFGCSIVNTPFHSPFPLFVLQDTAADFSS